MVDTMADASLPMKAEPSRRTPGTSAEPASLCQQQFRTSFVTSACHLPDAAHAAHTI